MTPLSLGNFSRPSLRLWCYCQRERENCVAGREVANWNPQGLLTKSTQQQTWRRSTERQESKRSWEATRASALVPSPLSSVLRVDLFIVVSHFFVWPCGVHSDSLPRLCGFSVFLLVIRSFSLFCCCSYCGLLLAPPFFFSLARSCMNITSRHMLSFESFILALRVCHYSGRSSVCQMLRAVLYMCVSCEILFSTLPPP